MQNGATAPGIKIAQGDLILRTWRHLPHKPGCVLIKASLSYRTGDYAYIQLYREFTENNPGPWRIDHSPSFAAAPFQIINSTDHRLPCNWGSRYTDAPEYDLGSMGCILFNTILVEITDRDSQEPANWSYRILFGFS